MNRWTHLLFAITSILFSGLMIGCDNNDQVRIVEEEVPGQFRQMARDAAAGEEDTAEDRTER